MPIGIFQRFQSAVLYDKKSTQREKGKKIDAKHRSLDTFNGNRPSPTINFYLFLAYGGTAFLLTIGLKRYEGDLFFAELGTVAEFMSLFLVLGSDSGSSSLAFLSERFWILL